MRKHIVVAISAALVAVTAIGCMIAFVAFSAGTRHKVSPVAQASPVAGSPPTTTAKPRPVVTVTITKRVTVRRPIDPPPRYYGTDDEQFLSAIAGDGIKAPDDWAIEAGRKTCGTGYGYAFGYLTDGGLYGYHVQTFLDDWITTHQGC